MRTASMLLVSFALAAGCSSSAGNNSADGTSTGGACTPAESRICPCADGTTSTQSCNADGSGYEPCQCSGNVGQPGCSGGTDCSQCSACYDACVCQGSGPEECLALCVSISNGGSSGGPATGGAGPGGGAGVPGVGGTGALPGTGGTGAVPGTGGMGATPGTGGTGAMPGTGGAPGTGGVAGAGGMGAVAGAGGAPPPPPPPGTGTMKCGLGTNEQLCNLAEGQKCCYLDPGLDYCAAEVNPCQCDQPGCTLGDFLCDGPEDCGTGEVCCGVWDGSRFSSLECRTDCGGPNFLVCQDSSQCGPGGSCAQAVQLPEFVQICF